jgi:hypothetical protein
VDAKTAVTATIVLPVFVAVCSGCWRGGSVYSQPEGSHLRDVVTVSLPYRTGVLERVLSFGEQAASEEGPICNDPPIGTSEWRTVLESDGYIVDAGAELQAWNGLVYGIRFRKDSIYGDVGARPNRNGCMIFTVRLQRATPHQPQRWKSAFAIDALVQPTPTPTGFGPAPPYFVRDPEYPPYP